jgi:hypothetical protein
MDEYEKLVERCRENRTSKRIENASITHARVLFRNLFTAALNIPEDEPKVVLIQCGTALDTFYSDFVDNVTNVMNSGVHVWMLVSDGSIDCSAHRFLSVVDKHPKGHLRYMGEGSDERFHFVVVGSSAYRIETNTSNIEAFANFNEPVLAAFAKDIFDRNWLIADESYRVDTRHAEELSA